MARLVADLAPLRRHRDFRRLWYGQAVSAMGNQLTVVGVSFQAYRLTRSQHTVPEHLQARLSGVFFAVVAGGPRPGGAGRGHGGSDERAGGSRSAVSRYGDRRRATEGVVP